MDAANLPCPRADRSKPIHAVGLLLCPSEISAVDDCNADYSVVGGALSDKPASRDASSSHAGRRGRSLVAAADDRRGLAHGAPRSGPATAVLFERSFDDGHHNILQRSD